MGIEAVMSLPLKNGRSDGGKEGRATPVLKPLPSVHEAMFIPSAAVRSKEKTQPAEYLLKQLQED